MCSCESYISFFWELSTLWRCVAFGYDDSSSGMVLMWIPISLVLVRFWLIWTCFIMLGKFLHENTDDLLIFMIKEGWLNIEIHKYWKLEKFFMLDGRKYSRHKLDYNFNEVNHPTTRFYLQTHWGTSKIFVHHEEETFCWVGVSVSVSSGSVLSFNDIWKNISLLNPEHGEINKCRYVLHNYCKVFVITKVIFTML